MFARGRRKRSEDMDGLGEDIRRQAQRFGFTAASPLLDAWPRVVGEQVATNAWPARISRSGELRVNTSSSGWAFELSQLAPRILEKLREALGEECPKGLRFAVGPVPARGGGPGEGEAVAPEIGPDERARGERLAAVVEDGELRDLIARAAAASLARDTQK